MQWRSHFAVATFFFTFRFTTKNQSAKRSKKPNKQKSLTHPRHRGDRGRACDHPNAASDDADARRNDDDEGHRRDLYS